MGAWWEDTWAAAEQRKRLQHLERRVLEAEANVQAVRAELDRAKAALSDDQRGTDCISSWQR